MVNICKYVIKIVKIEKRKRLTNALAKRQWR